MTDLPEVNIGMVGHIDHGKTTLTEALTGVWASRHSEELKRGITIKLGYADANFYKCSKCDEPACYSPTNKCAAGHEAKKLRTVSFVDAPGHETLMATMLSGASLIDGAILVIAANEKCPQPQTKEHLMALDIVGVKKVIVVQNKIDLVSEQRAKESYEEIKKFIKGTVAESAPVIPISAQHRANIDFLIETIENVIKSPAKKEDASPLMLIARSFDINKPGTPIENLHGGVFGGALVEGTLKAGEEVEISPGFDTKSTIKAKIVNINAAGQSVKSITRGGTFGVETLIDPGLTKADSLAGRVLGVHGKLPPVYTQLNLEAHLLQRVVGEAEELEIKPLAVGETLMLNIWTATSVGVVAAGKKGTFLLNLKIPVSGKPGARVTIARRFGTRWRLIGYGIIK